MAGHVVIRITERLGGGEPLRTAYAVAEPNQHRAVALFKLRSDHTADEQVEAVVELTQSALDSLGLMASSIRRRSAAWIILLDWTFRSRRRASALWMTQARSFGK